MTCSVVAKRAPGFIVPYRLLLRAALRSHIKPATSQKIIVLDWDDTLLCTWYLESVISDVRDENALATADAKLLSDLSELEETAVELVSAAARQGDVYVVTNSACKWVEFSARVYMPRMQAILAK
ncbi:MAG: hypothetical protein KVP17_001985 [Porospora cf. gigantea B]|uniref:uncharacterized protein n=1 Tax=Porospora cf. gigantea B TaxID=2853592 RepID=UPI003571B2BD|nr:MAG: hypothetical protein KVP17_001985 [Porospora cf. gigantea B]